MNILDMFRYKPKSKVTKDEVRKAIETLKKYKSGKANLQQKIVDNERWWKMQHWDIIRKRAAAENEPEPVTGYLFNTIANKHADAMDNYPEPTVLPRERMDQPEAESLTTIIPLVVEKSEFEEVYSDAWWYKLKHGFVVYGTFWNHTLENGLGDIDIRYIDALDIYWEPGIKNIQDSRNVFVVTLVDADLLVQQYPHLEGQLEGNKVIDVAQYVYDDNVDTTEKCLVVDWYYKKVIDGKTVLHLTKFVDEFVLESTEDDEELGIVGLYDHGEYPFDIDVLFPEEGTCIGFGYVDIVRNPQMYIDKLDQIISKNALMAGKKRFFIKDNGGVNEKEFADWSKDLVHVAGSVGEENIREFQVAPLHEYIVRHRQNKIEELKEIAGNRDFSAGGTTGGVTAASAIMALQEAGNKLSRDMIKASYRTYRQIITKCIELIRQFYDVERMFRIEGEDGQYNFIEYSNVHLKEQMLMPTYQGEEPKYRKPVFDITVKAEKANPFSKAVHNEFAKELYSMGMFNPQMAAQALIALEMMTFEGKEKIVKMIGDNYNMEMQMAQMQQTMDKMATIIQATTGRDMGISREKMEQIQRNRAAQEGEM
jgi:hypothetical protein